MHCKSWPEEDEDFAELDAQLITKTGHPATARFVNDLFEQAEVTLPGGEKVYAFLPVGSSKRLGDGTEAYIRPMKRRSDKVVVDSNLELALRSHAYCSLVDIKNYKALGVKDPICTLRFSDHMTLSTLWEFKSRGKGEIWSGAKLASFVFHQLLNRGKILKSDLTLRLDELETRENCPTETTIDGILANLRRLVEAMRDEETKPVSMKVSSELRQLAEKLQGEITTINKTTITDEVKI
ncbi:hypothetical protein BGZ95_006397, partial [Linnemannia exigua]